MKRKQCTAIRRQGTKIPRNTSDEVRQKAREEYSQKTKELRKLIRKAKTEHWKSLCNELNTDIWWDGYSIVVKAVKNLVPYQLPDMERRNILRELLPPPSSDTNYRER
ncbi:hypothetical protein QE152_g30282 [Popillia japonica]|uniref:Uncharacterized protein n=1 Tax=Popillia japonica TaxID=7064 RepID=A0AAW1JFJ3_POPJA